VVSIVGPGRYRVRRGIDGTKASRHPTGAAVWAEFPTPSKPPGASRRGQTGAPISLRRLHLTGLPAPRSPAERIWQRWFDRTPAALQSDGAGLVDNLYVSWLWQYGLLGLAICGAWVALLLWPLFARKKSAAVTSAALVGVFLIVGAAAVNIWEEAPTDLLAALVFAHAYRAVRPA
jgi:hypothetical protein